MEFDCIPAGMELFPAADEDQFEFIKRVIDDCDYYLLIIGGRYGSTDESGISYTEKEYDYALAKGLKVIALLHENPEEISLGKSEKDPVLRERLAAFREKVRSGRLVSFWKTLTDLPGLVALSLSKTIKMFPAVGWVRANKISSEELLTEINELRKLNATLTETVASLSSKPVVSIPNLAGLDEEVELHGKYWSGKGNDYHDGNGKTTWRNLFKYLSPYLGRYSDEDLVTSVLSQALGSDFRLKSFTLHDQDLQTISVQLRALGLVRVEYQQSTGGSTGLFWFPTPKGEKLMSELRTIRSAQKKDEAPVDLQ